MNTTRLLNTETSADVGQDRAVRSGDVVSTCCPLAVGLSIADDRVKVSEADMAVTVLVGQPVRETTNS
ncbi:hypothetical protein DPEC_G00292490 [Dallia pectoralis]|uniref:Uncharacterized protein n=1 Tax=Dallia pectoralis TaxID=75939 RepID=A0ACC2FIB3_DALPE|nr:hypothetical protein DPEC_G00292490 [Dallia pectoralis]